MVVRRILKASRGERNPYEAGIRWVVVGMCGPVERDLSPYEVTEGKDVGMHAEARSLNHLRGW
jgi:hypothetical protein